MAPDFETSKNYINHGRAKRWARRQASMGLIATAPPGASSRWVGRGRCRRICLHSLNRLRKKLFIDGIHFILCLYNLSSIVSNTITFHPPCALRRSRVLSCTSPVAPACFWLVVVCICVVYWPFKAATCFFLLFFVDQFDGRSDATAPSHTLHPGRLSPSSPLTPLSSTVI